eukprot:m51a1_g8105 hypothetical protein (93) ;mRNA; f:99141-99419
MVQVFHILLKPYIYDHNVLLDDIDILFMLTNEHIRIRGLDNNDSTFYRQWFEDIARKQSDKKEKKRVASHVYQRRLQAVIERESQEIDADVL